jgi:three-Cys-motif partner protein
MSDNDKFFLERKAAAVLKHGVISRYPTVFTSAAGSQSGNSVAILDGYAGPGVYEDGSAASVAELRDTRCIFVEQNDEYFARLDQLVTSANAGSEQHVALSGTVEDNIDKVIELSAGRALFAFLDPFGPALPYETMRDRLLRRPCSAPTEVLLLGGIARVGGAVVADEDLSAPGAERVDLFLGGDWWREEFKNAYLTEESATHAARRVAGRFAKKVKDETGIGFMRIQVRERPDLLPRYELALFTKNNYGMWRFNDAVSMANVEWQQAWRGIEDVKAAKKAAAAAAREKERREEAGVLSFFDVEVGTYAAATQQPYDEDAAADEWIDTIKANILRTAAERPGFKMIENIGRTYGETLGLAREKHVARACKALYAEGRIDNDGVNRKGQPTFYRKATRLTQ